jgi:hypothetical protein
VGNFSEQNWGISVSAVIAKQKSTPEFAQAFQNLRMSRFAG